MSARLTVVRFSMIRGEEGGQTAGLLDLLRKLCQCPLCNSRDDSSAYGLGPWNRLAAIYARCNERRSRHRTSTYCAHGKIAAYPAGTFLARPGEPIDRFVYVEEGEIEAVNPYTEERHLLPAPHRRRQFHHSRLRSRECSR
jgi:hypothetical protein